MIVVKKKMKKSLLIAILAATLAVLIAGAVIVNAVIAARGDNSGADGSSSAENNNLPTAREELGEYDYGGTPYAFAPVERAQIEYIQIRTKSFDKDGNPYTYEYSFLKGKSLGDEFAHLGNEFILSYTDKDGNSEVYYPPILAYDAETDYSSLYSYDQSMGYDIPLLYWLCSGIGNIRISARVDLPENEAEREKDLKAYGLSSEDTPIVIRFNYQKADKTSEDIVLQVGDVLATGSGYYFRVGSIATNENGDTYVNYRPCVYTTYEKSSLSYAFLEFSDFINPILIAQGLASDNTFEPYLTTDFKQWKNTPYIHDEENGISYVIDENAHIVIVNAKKLSPNNIKGGLDTDTDVREFYFASLKNNGAHSSLLGVLVGKNTGKYSSPITVTLPSYSREVELGDEVADAYTYEIMSIEAILTAAADNTEAGTVVSSGDKVKVSYKLKKNGEYVKEQIGSGDTATYGDVLTLHGVLDLSSELIPSEEKAKLVGKAVGAVSGVSINMSYSSANTVKREVKLYIDEIIDIRSTENYAQTLDTVQVGATVSIRCYDVVDGVKDEKPRTVSINITENMTGTNANIKDAIIGKAKTRNFDTTVNAYVASLELMQSFVTYEIDEIMGYVAREEIVSFKYTQDSERDPYYDESIYTNTMQDWRLRLYALEANSCERVVQFLGGLLENASRSEGLVGLKTVDVVITPEKMLRYGLYANTIYFELPRNILPVSETSSDYTYLSTLGFTLYISDVNPATNTRYIASSMYDIIAEIDAKNFEFLDSSFISFYARRNLVLTAVENIDTFDIEFFMDELHGTYTNKLEDRKLYIYGEEYFPSLAAIQLKYGEDAAKDAIETTLTRIKTGFHESAECPECTHSESLLEKRLKESGEDGIYLDLLYDKKLAANGEDYLGSDCFKEFVGTLYYTIYEDELTEQNISKVTADSLLMRFKVDLGPDYMHQYRYVYEFYRVSDRRVAVRLYKESRTGEIIKDADGNDIVTTDFYISGFAFKKLVSKYWEVVNAIPVNKDSAFTDYGIWG